MYGALVGDAPLAPYRPGSDGHRPDSDLFDRWLGGFAAAALFIGALKGRRALASAVGAIVVAAIAAISLLRIERIASHLNLSEGTTALRLDIWEAGLAMGRDHPITGVGLDSFLAYYPKYMLPFGLA